MIFIKISNYHILSSCSLAKSGSVPLLVKDGAIDRLVSEQVADADLVTWSLDSLLLGEGHVGPGVPTEYQLPTCPETKIMILSKRFQRDLRAVGAVAGNLGGGGVRFDDGEEEGGVGAVLLEVSEVQLEQTSRGETGVSVVRAGSAAFELLDKTIVDNVTAFGDVQEQVDLLDIVDQPIRPAFD